MHRQVRFTGQQRILDLLREQTLAADLREWDVLDLVPAGDVLPQLNGEAGLQRLQARLDPVALGQGQLTAPGGNAKGSQGDAWSLVHG